MPSPARYVPPKITAAPDDQSLLGFLRAIVRNPIGAAPASAYTEPVAVVSLSTATVVFVCDPDLLEEILVRRPADFPKSRVDDRILRPILGNSLLSAEGESWRWKRRLVAPYFTPAALAPYVPDMVAPFRAIAGEWAAGGADEPTDAARAMTAATFDVIRRVLFSNHHASDLGVLADLIDDYLQPIPWVTGFASLRVPEWVPHPGRAKMRRACRDIRSAMTRVIQARRAQDPAFSDICHDLMGAHDPETKRPLGDDDLIDMLLTLVAAGHETSAKGLTWALFCLAEQPDRQDARADEVLRAVGQSRAVDAADLPRLASVEAWIKETMRLFPPAPLMSRRTTRTEEMGGHRLPSGTILFIPIYALHRHARLWPDPDAFDPARFLGDTADRIRRTAYMPFGAGPRNCLGATFAMMEMVAGLATLLQRVRVTRPPGLGCEPIHRVTLRPKGGLPLTVTPRFS